MGFGRVLWVVCVACVEWVVCGTRAVSSNVVAFVASVAAVANVTAVTGKSYLRRDHLT